MTDDKVQRAYDAFMGVINGTDRPDDESGEDPARDDEIDAPDVESGNVTADPA